MFFAELHHSKLAVMKKLIFLFVFLFIGVTVLIVGCSKKDTPIAPQTPKCTANSAPANGTNVTTSTVTLSWSAASGATAYDVYLGTTNNPTTVIASNVSSTNYTYTIPSSANATYYWYVVPKNNSGAATGCSSAVTSFNYGVISGCATNTVPANSSNVTTKTVALTWSSVAGATGYDVYLGTTNNPTTVVASNVSSTSYTYDIPANFTTTYYWYVVPKNATGSSTGCSSTVTAFTYLVIKAPAAIVKPVIAYFPSYRSVSEYPDVMFKMCDIVNYAFADVNSSGATTINSIATFNTL